MPLDLFFAVLFGYLIGSIPFGLVITKLAGLEDIRKIGSGNIGATNVLRTGRKDLALYTLIADAGKAAFVALFFNFFTNDFTVGVFSGVAAVVGHNYPIWLKFKGGKGVASTLGLMLAMTPITGVLVALTWLLVAFTFKYSSLAALVSLILAPVYELIVYNNTSVSFLYVLLALLSIYRHRANIKRIIHGEETKIKIKRSK